MSTELSAKQKALQNKYWQLSSSERALLQVFALLYGPTSRVNAHKCWTAAIAQRRDGSDHKPLNLQQFGQQLKDLAREGFLVQDRTKGAKCAPLIVEIAARDAVRTGTFEAIAQAIHAILPISPRYYKGPRAFDEATFVRELRIAAYQENLDAVNALFDEVQFAYWRGAVNFYALFREMLTNPFDIDWMNSLSQDFFGLGLTLILEHSVEQCSPAIEAFDLLEDRYAQGELYPRLCLLYAEQLWLRGYLEEASEVLAGVTEPKHIAELSALLGAIAFLTGSNTDALAHYRTGLKAAGKSQDAQAAWFEHPAAVLFFFALLEAGTPAAYQEAEKYIGLIQKQRSLWIENAMPLMMAVFNRQQGKAMHTAQRFKDYKFSGLIGIPALLEIYALHWLDVPDIETWLPAQLDLLCAIALKSGYGWIALETAELLVSYVPDSPYAEVVESLREQADSLPLITVVQRQEAWELSLKALSNLTQPKKQKADTAPAQDEFRLIWRLRLYSETHWTLAPLEQKLSVKGGWTKGKAIALKRLYKGAKKPKYLTEQDRKICSTLEAEYGDNSYYYGRTTSYIFPKRALIALVGHPLVFWEDTPNVRVDVIAGEPELLVKRQGDSYLRLSLSPPVAGRDIITIKETPTRLKVIAVSADHRRIAEVLGPKNNLKVPVEAEERVLKAIATVANLVTVQSDIGGGVEAESVPADATPHIHLLPAGSGLKASLLAHPFPQGGAYYSPGQGGKTVIAEVDGKRLQTQRDLSAERKNAKQVAAACSILQAYKAEAGEWLIDEPSDCLELLLQLQNLGEAVIIEWPEGEKFKVSRQLGLGDFKFNIRQQQDWFAASGEVQISESRVMDLRQIMTLLENSPGQFVPLAEGEFLALTEEFRQRLQSLRRLAQPQGKSLRISGLAALAVEDMIDDIAQLEIDQAWTDHLAHINAARKIEPKVPDALQATLRDYQKQGYTWLARLANWGVGACLADDMGLGKTLQGLAVILSRSSQGPTLVVAPTSVCANWASEAERFAPSLQVKSFGEGDRANRQQLLDGLGPHDLVVCSYGLIQQEDVADMLAQLTWQTIVLDEAQAIKNHATKRSQAVMALQGRFKIAMTGTPVENHLGELWNLFRFINPGLLGSLESFNLRFANPIERDQDDAARDALRQLIQPFILRRTKDQVLKELPSRTEITLPVELSTEEMAFYEALRREAIEKLSEQTDMQAGQKHLQVLAEIMKLRRACCNPALVKPELAIPSTKLAQFSELIVELLDNGHKALVFSQFVDHLKILRQHLEKQQITYQYLDGSTPAKKRKQNVDAFQNGAGDVFLISLKAGGTGLNLTAADYVLHMDPWWNPAVEDQASDRAHRIGQQRPVTIYRLVAKGTIEDKIVALHKVKRDLADSLLTGTDMSSKVSTEELLSLIQQ